MRPFMTMGRLARHGMESALEAALIVGVIGALAFALTFVSGRSVGVADAKAGGGASPSLSVVMPAAGSRTGGSLTVHGKNFTPSNLGQQVMLWVGYPDDYCGPDACHGFYAYPNVAADGTFSETYDNVLLQAGTGTVKGIQYNNQRDKWITVAKATYTR